VEIHAGHGYLLSQFLSPWTNHRRDGYGGPLENRCRFPVEVVRAVRARVGADYPVVVKMNQRDGMRGGLELDEAVRSPGASKRREPALWFPPGGFTAATPLFMLRGGRPVKEMARAQTNLLYKISLALFGWVMVRRYSFEPLFLLEGARRVRDAVRIPVGYLGGALSREHVDSLHRRRLRLRAVGPSHDP